MHIDATVPGRREEFCRQDLSVRDDHGYVGLVRCEQFFRLGCFDLLRLMDCQTVLQGELFDRRLMELLATARGFIRLRPDGDDLMTVVNQPSQ